MWVILRNLQKSDFTNMKICLPNRMSLLYLTLLTVLIASDKVNGKAVTRHHSTRNDTDSSCNQEISNIITAFNTVKRDLEELKRSTDIKNNS